MLKNNVIRDHIYTIPDLIESHAVVIWKRVNDELPNRKLKKVRKIIVTGCGYSYAAAIQAKYIFETVAGIPTEVAFSIDAARHLNLGFYPEETLLIGVSSSGIVARIAETLERFRRAGVFTLAFSSDMQSRCAKEAEHIIDISCPAMEQSLPLRSYVMTIMGYYATAWLIALEKGYRCEAEKVKFYDELFSVGDSLNRFLKQIEVQTDQFSEKTYNSKAHEFVGSGMEYGSAWLGRQQIIGQSGKCGIECSLEDWLHSDFFWNEPKKIGTILFMPSNTRSLSRAREVQNYMLYLKRPVCIVTDKEELVEKGAYKILLPQTQEYILNPILELIPVSLYAGKITQLIGEEYSRGFREQWDFSKGGYATEFSEIQIIE